MHFRLLLSYYFLIVSFENSLSLQKLFTLLSKVGSYRPSFVLICFCLIQIQVFKFCCHYAGQDWQKMLPRDT